MKAFLFGVAALLVCSGVTFAQNLPPDYFWEVGLNSGYSQITRPLGPADSYAGTRTKLVHDYSVRLDYFITPHWMVNLDVGMCRWETYDNWQVNGLFGQQLQPQEVSLLLADYAVNETVAMNYVIPFYTHFNTFNRANINFGASFGLMTTVNDGSTGYKIYHSKTDSGQVYVNKYDYAPGIGYTFGVQAGFTYYFLPRFAVNIDVAARFAHVNTDEAGYRQENSKFYLLYFPETLGIRWRF